MTITVLPLDTPGLGDRTYLAHDGEVALVVDPQRDYDRVLGIAEAEQVLADEAGSLSTFVAVLADREVQVLLSVSDDADVQRVRSAWAAAGLTVEALA